MGTQPLEGTKVGGKFLSYQGAIISYQIIKIYYATVQVLYFLTHMAVSFVRVSMWP
jgi:hypothetical protein